MVSQQPVLKALISLGHGRCSVQGYGLGPPGDAGYNGCIGAVWDVVALKK